MRIGSISLFRNTSFALFCIFFFLCIPSFAFAKNKVAVIGSSSYAGGCNYAYGFVNKLKKAYPDTQFDCFTKSGSSANFFLEQYNANVKGKGYNDIILFGGLNGLNSEAGLKSTQQNLKSIFIAAETEKTRVIVTGSQPFKGYPSWTQTWADNLKKNNTWLATKPHGLDIYIDIYPLVDKNNDDALDSIFDSGDHLHMGAKGHELLYGLIANSAYGASVAAPTAGAPTTVSSGPSPVNIEEIKKIIETPQPRIKIPGLTFTPTENVPDLVKKEVGINGKEGIYITIPYIGEYLATIYRFAVVAASMLAVVFIIIGGFMWTTSAGSADRITAAKTMIERALTGLILAVGSYIILYTINPELVQFRSLKILYIPTSDIDGLVFSDEENTPDDHSGKPFSSTAYDEIFKKYATCSGMNWELYKAIAHHESGLNASIVNPKGTATGLFQCIDGKNHGTCRRVLKNIGWEDKCDTPGLKDPEVNNAYATLLFRSNAKTITGRCGSASFDDKVFMLYFGHSSGPGALTAAIRLWGCDIDDWPEDGAWPKEALYGLGGKKIYNGASRGYIEKIVKKVNAFNIETFEGPKNSNCPIGK